MRLVSYASVLAVPARMECPGSQHCGPSHICSKHGLTQAAHHQPLHGLKSSTPLPRPLFEPGLGSLDRLLLAAAIAPLIRLG